jgi:outer membrane protein TolC
MIDICITIQRLMAGHRYAVAALLAAMVAPLWPALHAAEADGTAIPTGRQIDVVIGDYVRIGLAGNLALANQSLEAEKAMATLQSARARFFPEVSLSARYTSNSGGREIDFPLSSLLNPAYQTLNELLVASSQAPRFPPLGDNSFRLLRAHEQDTHLTLRQPLYAPGLASNVSAARAGANAAAQGRDALRRQLTRDISRAYLDTEKARSAVAIVDSNLTLLAENLRVNESLYSNGRLTQDAVLRARAEWLAVQQKKVEAQNGVAQAGSYLNFLLNRPLATSVEAAALPAPPPGSASTGLPAVPGNAPDYQSLSAATARARASRPELQQLTQAANASELQLRAARAQRLPSLALGIDSGIQGDNYGVGPRYNYTSGSLLLNWTLFDGAARSAAISRARLTAMQSRNQREQGEARVALEVQQAQDALHVSEQSLATAGARLQAAAAALRIATRKRDAGAMSQAEFLDASNSATAAELNLSWTRYDLLQRRADYAYASGADEAPLAARP